MLFNKLKIVFQDEEKLIEDDIYLPENKKKEKIEECRKRVIEWN